MKYAKLTAAVLTIAALSIHPQTISAGPPEPIPELWPISAASVQHGPSAPTYVGCGGVTAPSVNAAYEQQVVELVNQFRAEYNLPPLKRASGLDTSARYHATDMGQESYFDHNSYDRVGGNLVLACEWYARIQSYYPDWRSLGENIAAGYSTPHSVMNGWKSSTMGHRENMLSTSNWEIGVGYYAGSGSYYHYWVQDLGRRSGVYPIVINREATATQSRHVSLYLYGDWSEMRLRNDGAAWTAWQPFQSTVAWTLSSGASGERTVWAEMRDGGQTALSSDVIYLDLPTIPPTAVTIDGPMAGLVGDSHTLTATIRPIDATQPITYTWRATGHTPVTHVGGSSDTIILAWDSPGQRTITVTVTNAGGTATSAHTLVVNGIPAERVEINGPSAGFINTPYPFSATTDPITATQPITYTWQVDGRPAETRAAGRHDEISLAWSAAGPHTITVTATNAAEAEVTAAHAITIAPGPSVPVSPTLDGSLVYTDGQGSTTTISVPAEAVTELLTIHYTPLTQTFPAPQGMALARHAFILEAFRNGLPLPLFTLHRPATVTLEYSDADVRSIAEDSLAVYAWREGEGEEEEGAGDWRLAAATCSPSTVLPPQPDENRVQLTICHLGEFALFGREWTLYLPILMRQ